MNQFEKNEFLVPRSKDTFNSRRTLTTSLLIARSQQKEEQKKSGFKLVCSKSCAVPPENSLNNGEVLDSWRQELIFHFLGSHHLIRKHNNRHWTVP